MLISLRAVPMLILFVTACGASGKSASPTFASSTTGATIPGLRAVLEAPTTIRKGDSLPLRLVLYNDTNAGIALPMMTGGGLGFDPVVRNSSGALVWRRLAGQYVLQDGEVRTIPPQQTTGYQATWNLRDVTGALVGPGTYRVTGRLVDGSDSVVTAPEMTIAIVR